MDLAISAVIAVEMAAAFQFMEPDMEFVNGVRQGTLAFSARLFVNVETGNHVAGKVGHAQVVLRNIMVLAYRVNRVTVEVMEIVTLMVHAIVRQTVLLVRNIDALRARVHFLVHKMIASTNANVEGTTRVTMKGFVIPVQHTCQHVPGAKGFHVLNANQDGMQRNVNSAVRNVVEIKLVTKHQVCVPLGRVPLVTLVLCAPERALQNVSRLYAILLLATVFAAQMVILARNVINIVRLTAIPALTPRCVSHVNLDVTVKTAKETVHSVVGMVNVRSQMERV